MPVVRHVCRLGAALAALLLVWVMLTAGAEAGNLAEFHAAVERASERYRIALQTLESRGREETASAVHRFRDAWQAVADRFEKDRPAFGGDEQYAATLLQVDMRIISALIVIDIGSREAARDALAPIAETLAQLSARSAPPR
jgi:hypothetical protein